MHYLKNKWLSYKGYTQSLDPIRTSLFTTLLWGTVFFYNEDIQRSVYFSSLSVIGIFFFDKIKASKLFWAIYTGAYILFFSVIFPTADNHSFLFLYWLISIVLFTHHRDEKILKNTASLLLGLVFTFATIWKIYYGQYLDGTFFNISFISDVRFHPYTELFLGYSKYDLDINYYLTSNFLMQGTSPLPFTNSIEVTNLNKVHSYIWAYGTIVIEGLLGLTFLTKPFRDNKVSEFILVAFLISIYWLLQIKGFAALLIILGFCLSKKVFRPYYIIALAIIIFISFP